MDLAALLGLTGGAAVGSLLLLGRLGRRDQVRESILRLVPFLVVGVLSIVPGLFFYGLVSWLAPARLPGRWQEILFVWTVNAPLEEVAKYLCFLVTAMALRSIREPQDGSLQGAATGLGFALGENFLYALSGGWQLLLVRTLFSLPGHVIYGAVWGGYHGFEVYQGRGRVRRWSVPLLALVPAAFAHGLFNTLVIVQAPLVWALLADTATLGLGAFLFVRLRAHSPIRIKRPLRQWRLAIPELEHALVLDPSSSTLRRRLAAYLLVADRANEALAVLSEVPDSPWTLFYRDAAMVRLGRGDGSLPASASLAPGLFRTLTGA